MLKELDKSNKKEEEEEEGADMDESIDSYYAAASNLGRGIQKSNRQHKSSRHKKKENNFVGMAIPACTLPNESYGAYE